MGAWGIGNFENDTALDWVGLFLEGDQGIQLIAQTFEKLNQAIDYLDADDGCYALAACEVIAALKGNPCSPQPEGLQDWMQMHHFEEVAHLVDPALKAIERITGDRSELRGLWAGSDEYASWLAVQTDLQARLRNSGE